MDENECLLGKEKPSIPTGFVNSVFSSSSYSESERQDTKEAEPGKIDELDSAIVCVRRREATGSSGNMQTVIDLTSRVSYKALKAHLQFLYTGQLPKELTTSVEVSLAQYTTCSSMIFYS